MTRRRLNANPDDLDVLNLEVGDTSSWYSCVGETTAGWKDLGEAGGRSTCSVIIPMGGVLFGPPWYCCV